MSQPKAYEAASIEEALRAVSIDLGDDIEIVSAVKERRGGVFGFFAKERFVVTAQNPTAEVPAEGEDFGELLLSLTDSVEDTWEGSTPITTPTEDAPSAPPAGFTSVIDLRSGKRTLRAEEHAPTPASAPTQQSDGFSFNSERPSQLRRRIRAAELADTPSVAPALPEPAATASVQAGTEPTVLSIAGPLNNLGDSAPDWSLTALRSLGLPMLLLETVQEFDPASDIEWMHAIAIGIDRMMPDPDAPNVSWVVGEGRSSAVELIRGIPFGRLPAAIVLPGRQVRATPDELSLSLRECIR